VAHHILEEHMLTALAEINWLAVVAATVLFAVLGGVYFSVVVAKPYRVALGNENRELPKPGPLTYVGPLIASLVVVITSAVLLRALAIADVGAGIIFGVVISIGYLVAQTLNIAINPNFPRPLLYTLINAPYFIVCTVAASVILTLWR
jgi:hypothetical protein